MTISRSTSLALPWAALVAVLLLGAVAPAHGTIYKYVDDNGVIHLADRPLGPGYRPIGGLRLGSGQGSYIKRQARYSPLIKRAAHRYKMDSALIHAVVRAESAFDASAVSRAGAVGLMQLMPDTARRYGVRNRRNPTENVSGGVRYLRDLLRRYKSITLALAAYNAGESAVARYGNKIPPFPETREYVRRVLDFYRAYRRES